MYNFFFLNDTATTDIYTLSLHDALPILTSRVWYRLLNCGFRLPAGAGTDAFPNFASLRGPPGLVRVYVKTDRKSTRLNSSHSQISYAVFCLKKNKKLYTSQTYVHYILVP